MPSVRHKADVSFEDGRIVVRLGGGVLFSFPIAGNRLLEQATPEQLVNVEVDEEGMHWPDIDEDLSLAGLLRGDWGQFMRGKMPHAESQRGRGAEGEGVWFVREGEAPVYGAGKPVVYLETSFVSNLTGRKATEPRKIAMQEASRKWWDEEGAKWHSVVSEAVRDEAQDGDADAVEKRLEFIDGFEMMVITEEAATLADVLMRENNLPEKCRTDALHVALAAIRRADLLLTWNCKHIANSVMVPRIAATLARAGYACPALATPAQRLEERSRD